MTLKLQVSIPGTIITGEETGVEGNTSDPRKRLAIQELMGYTGL